MGVGETDGADVDGWGDRKCNTESDEKGAIWCGIVFRFRFSDLIQAWHD